jgi:pyrroline-5-carboxylate reductase
VLSPAQLILCDRDKEKLFYFEEKGCRVTEDSVFAAGECDAVLLAVKPQIIADVMADLSEACRGKLVITIAAGVKIARLVTLGSPFTVIAIAIGVTVPPSGIAILPLNVI